MKKLDQKSAKDYETEILALKNNVQMTLEQFIEFMALSHWGEKSYQHLSDEFHRVNSTGSITAYEFYESVLDILRYEKFKIISEREFLMNINIHPFEEIVETSLILFLFYISFAV